MGSISFAAGYGRGVNPQPETPLGIPIDAGGGEMFRSVLIGEAWDEGTVLTDASHTDLVTATETVGTPTAAAAVGTRVLADTGNYGNANLLVGAVGTITSGAGSGQSFIVTEVPNANTLHVYVFAADGNRVNGNGGWETALTTASQYRLSQPGMATKFAAATDRVIGVACGDVAATDVGKYTQAQSCGAGLVLYDSTTTIAQNAALGVGTSGKAVALTASLNTAKNSIGYVQTGVDTAGTTDILMPVMLDIPLYGQGERVSEVVAENNN